MILILFLKYSLRALLISIGAGLIIAFTATTRTLHHNGNFDLTRSRIGIAMLCVGILFVLQLLLFPYLVWSERRRNPDRELTLATLDRRMTNTMTWLHHISTKHVFGFVVAMLMLVAAVALYLDWGK